MCVFPDSGDASRVHKFPGGRLLTLMLRPYCRRNVEKRGCEPSAVCGFMVNIETKLPLPVPS